MSQLQGLGAITHELEAAGAEILALSPDPNTRSQELAERLHVHYRFLSDTDLAVSHRLGMIHPRGGKHGEDVPRPATIVIDKDGVVRWAKFTDNVQTRPSARDVLRVVQSL